jgi:integrase
LLALGKGGKTGRLWIDHWGKPMSEGAIRTQIEFNTLDAFGRHIWPRLFRAIAVTRLVDEAPEAIGITPDLLAHASAQTTSRHYILASATRAHQRVQASFMEGRAKALRRLGSRDAAKAENSREETIHRIKIVRKGGNRG